MSLSKLLLVSLICALPFQAGAAVLDLVFETPQDMSDSQSILVDEAEAFWERQLPGYQPGVSIERMTITLGARTSDGEGGVLASAGPRQTVQTGGFLLPTTGAVNFDLADVDRLERQGSLFGVLIHEVAHALGFGTLWEENGVYVVDTGRYTGTYGVRAYRNEFDPRAWFVPVEQDGGPGTADGHWDETWAGGPRALMTGYYDEPVFLTDTTLASFRDIGYAPKLASGFQPDTAPGSIAPIPVPAGIGLSLSGLMLLAGLALAARHRQRACC